MKRIARLLPLAAVTATPALLIALRAHSPLLFFRLLTGALQIAEDVTCQNVRRGGRRVDGDVVIRSSPPPGKHLPVAADEFPVVPGKGGLCLLRPEPPVPGEFLQAALLVQVDKNADVVLPVGQGRA